MSPLLATHYLILTDYQLPRATYRFTIKALSLALEGDMQILLSSPIMLTYFTSLTTLLTYFNASV